MSLTKKRNQVIEDFIDIYKSEPCLWRVKSKEYHDRSKRDAAYDKLLRKLKEVEPDATKDSTVKKINNLRSNVRKEKKKIEASVKSGTSPDDIYKPSLWYYDLFEFLGDQDTPRVSTSNLYEMEGNEDEEENVEESEQSLSEAQGNAIATNNDEERSKPRASAEPRTLNSRPNLTKRKKQDDLTTDVLMSVRDHFKRPPPQEDRYDLLGKTVALKVRGLEKRQRVIAEKMINDILFEAEMGTLAPPPRQRTVEYIENMSSDHSYPSGSPSPNSYTSGRSPLYVETHFVPSVQNSATIGPIGNNPQHSPCSIGSTSSYFSQYQA